MEKTVHDATIIMNPWSRKEISYAWVPCRLCMEFVFMFSLSGYIWLTAPSAFVLPIYENIASQFGQLAILETCFGLILPYHATCSYDDYLRPRRLFVAFRS